MKSALLAIASAAVGFSKLLAFCVNFQVLMRRTAKQPMLRNALPRMWLRLIPLLPTKPAFCINGGGGST